MKKITGKVTDIDFFSRKSTLPTCPINREKRIGKIFTKFTVHKQRENNWKNIYKIYLTYVARIISKIFIKFTNKYEKITAIIFTFTNKYEKIIDNIYIHK